MAQAILTNNRAQISELLAAGRGVDERVPGYDEPPLHLAAQRKRPEIVRILVEHGADLALQNAQGETAWDLLWNSQVPLTQTESETARVLLEAGFDPGISPGRDGRGLLHQAALRMRDKEAVLWIARELDPSVNSPDAYGFTPLHLAAFAVNYDACEALLELGANPNAELPQTIEKYILDAETDHHYPHYIYRLEAGSRPLDIVPHHGTKGTRSVHPLLEKYGAERNRELRNHLPGRLDFPEQLPKSKSPLR